MFTNNFDPVAFNFFIFDIRWYSLSYILGILLGWIYIKKFYLTDSSSEALFDKYISYLIIGIIIGALFLDIWWAETNMKKSLLALSWTAIFLVALFYADKDKQ